MPSPHARARHAAPRPPLTRRSAALPGTLLLTAGIAFGGLAVLPAAAEEAPASTPSALTLPPTRSVSPAPFAALRAASADRAPAPAASRSAGPAAQANAALAAGLAKGLALAVPSPKPSAKPSPEPEPAPPAYVRPDVGPLSSRFGMRWGRLHAGIDLAGPLGSPIRAVAAGTVLASGQEGGYGMCIRLTHPDGTVTVYGHMSALIAKAGQQVAAGDVIGLEGNTGHSTGPHLHFEVRKDDVPLDPIPWLVAHGITV